MLAPSAPLFCLPALKIHPEIHFLSHGIGATLLKLVQHSQSNTSVSYLGTVSSWISCQGKRAYLLRVRTEMPPEQVERLCHMQ